MKSSAYWANRANERMVGYIGGADKAADEVANAYWQASEYIRGETEKIFRGFYEAGVLSETQAKMLLNQLPDDMTLDALKKGLAGIPEGKERQAALQLVNSPAYAARIRRLEELQREIDAKIGNIAQFEYKKSTDFYIDVLNEAYGRTAYDIQRGTGYGFSVSGLNEKRAAEVLRHNWSGAHYSSRIWNNTEQLAGRIKQDILSGFLSGKSGVKTARQIQEDFSVGAMEARRLVRTETNYMANQAELASYADCGIEQYEYLATLDMRTSAVCQGLDGKRFPIDKAVPGQNYPPMHPFCRSTTVAVIGNEETADMERRARDPVTGKTYRVPADMTYGEWKEKYINQNPEGRFALKKFENRYVDKDQYKRYKLIYGKETIPSFAKFQEIKYNNSEEWSRLKAEKQERLNQKDYSLDMNGMFGKMETRSWYKAHIKAIPERLNKAEALEVQAFDAFSKRNEYRTQARAMMKDRKIAEKLELAKKNIIFDDLIKRKQEKYGLTGDALYKDIIRSSAQSNKSVDAELGF